MEGDYKKLPGINDSQLGESLIESFDRSPRRSKISHKYSKIDEEESFKEQDQVAKKQNLIKKSFAQDFEEEKTSAKTDGVQLNIKKSIQSRLEMMPKKHRTLVMRSTLANTQQIVEQLNQEGAILINDVESVEDSKKKREFELKYLSPLSFNQKLHILMMNTLEIVFSGLLLFNSVAHFDLCSLFNLIISMALAYMICSAGRLFLAFKKRLLIMNSIVAISLLITKLTLIFLKKVNIENQTQTQIMWHNSFGFVYDEFNESIEIAKSIRQELSTISITFVYLLYLEKHMRVFQGRDRIQRTLTRIIPISRQRVLHHEINAANNSASRLQRTQSIKNILQQNLPNQAIQFIDIWNHESKQVKETIKENIIFHPYFARKLGIFVKILCFLLLLDAALYQSLVQFLQFGIVVVILYQNHETGQCRRAMIISQLLISAQIVVISILNTPILLFHFEKYKNNMAEQLVQITLGSLKSNQTLNQSLHLLICSFIIPHVMLLRNMIYFSKRQMQLTCSETSEDTFQTQTLTQKSSQKQEVHSAATNVYKKYNEVHEIEEKPQTVKIQQLFGPFQLLWVCRALAIVFAYMYHDYQSLIAILWVAHSTIAKSIKSFSAITKNLYLPLLILTILFYYACNIEGLIDFPKVNRVWIFGFYRFQNPLLEIGFMQFLIVNFIIWIKQCELLHEQDEDLRSQGVKFANFMSRKEANTFQNLVLLSVPLIETFLLLVIMISGLNRVDLYHIVQLFLFIGFLGFPDKKTILTKILIVYASIFIFAKYFITLLNPNQQVQELLQVIGIYSHYDQSQEQTLFEYPFRSQQWIVLIIGSLQNFIQNLLEDSDHILDCCEQAISNLQERYPRGNRIFQFIYNLKRKIILVLILAIFYLIIELYPRSLINWGFLLILTFLIYIEVSQNNLKVRQNCWSIMIVYSSLTIGVNILYLFFQLPYMRNRGFIYDLKKLVPTWICEHLDIVGLEVLNLDHILDTQIIKFAPYLIYFVCSVYIKSQMSKWAKEDIKFEKEFLKSSKRRTEKDHDKILDQSGNVMNMLKQNLNQLQKRHSQLRIEYGRIRFSPKFIAYSTKNHWSLIDFYCQYNYMLVQFIILMLTVFWWLNLANCIQVIIFLIFNLRVESNILRLRNRQTKEAIQKQGKVILKRQGFKMQDQDLITQYNSFEKEVKNSIYFERYLSWHIQYILISLVLCTMYPSEFIKDQKVMYYMFLCGIYHEGNQQSFVRSTSGYIIMLILILTEKVCLQWLYNRFGCNEDEYEIIDKFEVQIKSIEQSIEKIQKKLQNSNLIEKVARMKAARKREDMLQSFQEEIIEILSQAENQISRKQTEVIQKDALLKDLIQERLLIDARINILKGFKCIVEELIMITIAISAVQKMNVLSLVQFLLIVMLIYKKDDGSMRVVLFVCSTMLALRLLVILSNINEAVSPMPYPAIFHGQKFEEYFIPWVNKISSHGSQDFAQWTYFFTITMVPKKIMSVVMDYMSIFMIFVYYQSCQFWVLYYNFEHQFSEDTQHLLKNYIKQINYDDQSKTIDSQVWFTSSSDSNLNKNVKSLSNDEKLQKNMQNLIQDILRQSHQFRFYKFAQRVLIFYFPKVMIGMFLLLAIMSNTLFSLGFIIIVSGIMFMNDMFLNIKIAKKKLYPTLMRLIIPYILLELLLTFIYQMPFEIFKKQNQEKTYHLAEIIGISKHWQISIVGDTTRFIESVYSNSKIIQLVCKVIMISLVNTQAKIITSQSYYKLKDMLSLGQKKGQAMVWRFNNQKIKNYLKYQSINLKKEQMMIKVKENCIKWRKLFEKSEDELNLFRTVEPSLYDIDKRELDEPKNQEMFFQSVNSDYLAVRELMKRRAQKKGFRQDVEDSEQWSLKFCTPEQEAQRKRFKEKKAELPLLIWIYLKIRKNCVNPIHQVNNKERIQSILDDMKRGETKVRSSIEYAMFNDIKQEQLTGQPTNESLNQQTTLFKMFIRYLKLIQEFFQSSLEIISYFFMIYACVRSPGILTLVYPFSVFGYALMEETRPSKHYWYFIMFYTQFLLIAEFIFSLKFWHNIFTVQYHNIKQFSNEYYLGLGFVQGNEVLSLMWHFFPKILILWSAVTFCHNEIILDLFEQKEQDKESISDAYIRFITGQFGIQLNEATNDDQSYSHKPFISVRQEINDQVINYMLTKSLDDSFIHQSDNFFIKAEILQYMDDYRPFKSEQDIYENKLITLKDEEQIKKLRLCHNIKNGIFQMLVESEYMQRLFPSLKIQKPGIDFYSPMVLVQVFMCIFVIIWYPSMDAESSQNLLSQVSRNQFSGPMVVVLAIMILLMIVDRYIYKNKSFRQSKSDGKRNLQGFEERKEYTLRDLDSLGEQQDQQQNFFERQLSLYNPQQRLNTQKEKRNKYEGEMDKITEEFKESSFRSNSINQGGNIDEQIKFNLDELLARSKMTLRNVMKFYFQWIVLILVHFVLFFYLPITGNIKLNQQSYCDENKYGNVPDYKCNDLNKNKTLLVFYILSCAYFFISALQVKHGFPEVMSSYFMMWRFHWSNKYVFNTFMVIPFLFELRIFIDWTFTKTALDVYQWIKLSQCQVDLYKAKCNNLWYNSKPLGEKLPKWYHYSVGLSLVGSIFLLSLGPMFLFSSFNFFGQINPISKAGVAFKLNIMGQDKVLSSYQFFETQTIQKMQDQLNQSEFDNMGFGDYYQTSNYDKSQIQYLVMNNFPGESWLISDPTKKTLISNLELYLNDDKDLEVELLFDYHFTRAAPSAAITPQAQQEIKMKNLPNRLGIIEDILKALTAECNDTTQEGLKVTIRDQMSPVISLGLINRGDFIEQPDWKKTIVMTYYPCNNYWTMDQEISQTAPEYQVYKNVSLDQDHSTSGVSIFVISRRILPSYLNLPLLSFYISIIYVIAKLYRSTFVPITAAIFINDAPHPDEILMLCETIIIYRLKECFTEEEELFYLLIDIMRSPQVFKAICGEIKKSKVEDKEEQSLQKLKAD